jgi:hypothetical protein
MSRYEWTWTLPGAFVAAAGLIASRAAIGVPAMLGLFALVTMIGGMFVLPWLPTLSWRSRAFMLAGPTAGAVAVVELGLVSLLGVVPAVLVTIALAASSPVVTDAIVSRMPKSRYGSTRRSPLIEASVGAPVVAPHMAEPLPLKEVVVPAMMEDEDLRRAWRSSCVALERAGSTQSRLRVVQMRALYLDELERRRRAASRLDHVGCRCRQRPGKVPRRIGALASAPAHHG